MYPILLPTFNLGLLLGSKPFLSVVFTTALPVWSTPSYPVVTKQSLYLLASGPLLYCEGQKISTERNRLRSCGADSFRGWESSEPERLDDWPAPPSQRSNVVNERETKASLVFNKTSRVFHLLKVKLVAHFWNTLPRQAWFLNVRIFESPLKPATSLTSQVGVWTLGLSDLQITSYWGLSPISSTILKANSLIQLWISSLFIPDLP